MRHALTFGAGLCLVAALAAPGLRPDVSASEKAPAVASLTLDNVHLRAADPVAAAKWYVDHLAARPGVGPTQVVFGDFVIAFVKTDRPQPSLGSVIDHIAVSVTDVNARAAAMMSAGATRQAATRDLPGFDERIVLVDPFGVSIELLKDGRPGFHHVHLRVPQPTKALDWFSSMLGGSRATLRKRTDGVRFGQFWLLADASGSETPAPSAERAIQNIAWQVSDMNAAAQALKSRGVATVIEPRALGALWYAFFEGIDGVRVELLQRPAKSAPATADAAGRERRARP